MELITVGVTVFNIGDVVGKCIESILNQSYTNTEILLVDDGSTDNSGQVCDSYAKKDSRVRVIHQKNQGVSAARNAVIENSTGKYIAYVDGDDYIEPDYLSYLYGLLAEHDADISICGFKFVDENGRVLKESSAKKLFVLDRKQTTFENLNHRKFETAPWGKLYKKELFDGLRFPVGKIFEDVLVGYRLILNSKRAVIGPEEKYNYFQSTNSITRSEFKPSRLDAIEFGEIMVRDVLKEYPDMYKMADCRMFDSYIAVLRLIKNQDQKEVSSQMWAKLKKVRKNALFYSRSGLDRKVLAFASYFGVIL